MDTISPDIAKKVLSRDFANLIQRVQRGGSLSQSERARLESMAATAAGEPPAWLLTTPSWRAFWAGSTGPGAGRACLRSDSSRLAETLSRPGFGLSGPSQCPSADPSLPASAGGPEAVLCERDGAGLAGVPRGVGSSQKVPTQPNWRLAQGFLASGASLWQAL